MRIVMKKNLKNAISKARGAMNAGTIDEDELREALEELETASKEATPWWVIVLKTLAYLIGLLLAGYGTTAAAQTMLGM